MQLAAVQVLLLFPLHHIPLHLVDLAPPPLPRDRCVLQVLRLTQTREIDSRELLAGRLVALESPRNLRSCRYCGKEVLPRIALAELVLLQMEVSTVRAASLVSA